MRTGEIAIGDVTESPHVWSPESAPVDATFQCVDIASVDRETKQISSATTLLCADAPSRARQIVRADDVLVSTVRPALNGVALVPPDSDGAIASTGFCVLRPGTRVRPRFLYHWVRSPRFVREMVRRSTGASDPAVSESTIRRSRMPLPALDEQRRIATILDRAGMAMRRSRDAEIAVAGFAGLNFDDIRSLRIPAPPKELQLQFRAIRRSADQVAAGMRDRTLMASRLAAALSDRAFRGES